MLTLWLLINYNGYFGALVKSKYSSMPLFPGPADKAPLTILQVSAALFFIPAYVAARHDLFVGAVVYATNGVVSIAVHRPLRLPNYDTVDMLDHACICLWVVYNSWRFAMMPSVPAIICVFGVIFTKWLTTRMPWRTPRRYAVHCLMHGFGALGSLFVLPGLINDFIR